MMAGVEMIHVPYRGSSPALTDLLAGQVQVMFDATPSSLPHIRVGKLRPLAVTTATRLEVLPDVPTVGDFVPGYEASSWLGFGAPKNTPAAVIDRLSKEINLAISHSSIKRALPILGDWYHRRVRPLTLESFWRATPKSGPGSFARQTSNRTRHSITLRAAARDADDWGPFGERVHAEEDNGAALGIGWMGAATQGGGRRHRARDNASRARLAFSRA